MLNGTLGPLQKYHDVPQIFRLKLPAYGGDEVDLRSLKGRWDMPQLERHSHESVQTMVQGRRSPVVTALVSFYLLVS